MSMPVTLNTANLASTFNNGAPDSLSFNHTLDAADDGVVVGYVLYGSFSGTGGSPATPTVTYGGVDISTPDVSVVTSTFFGGLSVLKFIPASNLPAAGLQAVVVDHDNNVSGAAAFAVGVQGSADQAAEAVGSGNRTGSGTSTDNITTVSNNALVVDCLMTAFSGIAAMSAGAGEDAPFIDTPLNNNNVRITAHTKTVPTAGPTTMTLTWPAWSIYTAHSSLAIAEASAVAPDYAIDFTSDATALAAPAVKVGSGVMGPLTPNLFFYWTSTDAGAIQANATALTVIADVFIGVSGGTQIFYESGELGVTQQVEIGLTGVNAAWVDNAVRQSAIPIPRGRHVLAYTCAGSGAQVYVDGVLLTSIPAATFRVCNENIAYFGAARNGAISWRGAVWDVEVYGSELSAGDVAAQSAAIAPTFPNAWVSGASYNENDVVRYNSRDYYARTTHTGLTDTPDVDFRNWAVEWVYSDSYNQGNVVGWGFYDGGTPDIYYARTTHSGLQLTPDIDTTNWTPVAPQGSEAFLLSENF